MKVRTTTTRRPPHTHGILKTLLPPTVSAMKHLGTFVAALLVSAPLAYSNGRTAEADLRRPSPAPAPNAAGRLEMCFRNHHEQQFRVEIAGIDSTLGTYTLWITSNPGSGGFQNAGDFVSTGANSGRFERIVERHGRQDVLPLRVNNLSQLQNRRLEVRNPNGATILLVTIPRLKGNNGRGSGSNWIERELPLLRPIGEPIPEAMGKVKARWNGQDSELEIETEGFDVRQTNYSAWIEDGNASLQNTGDLRHKGRDGGEISWETNRGDTLPVGANTILDLAGRRIEIRNSNGTVVLEGSVPDLASTGRTNPRTVTPLVPTTTGGTVDAKGKLAAKLKTRNGRFQLMILARARTTETQATLWMEDTAGQMRQVATGTWSSGNRKRVRWQWRSERGRPLPLGITDPSQFFGREVQVRSVTGDVILTGRM